MSTRRGRWLVAGALVMVGAVAHPDGKPPKLLASQNGVGVYVAREDGHERLYVVDHPKPAVAIATLDLGPGTRKAKLTHDWLRVPGLLEVQIASAFSNGQRESAATRHVLLRRDAAGVLQVACEIGGRVATAMESSGSETSATFALVGKAPLTIEVTYETRATRWGPRRGAPPEKVVSRYELVDGSTCKELTPPRPTSLIR